LSFVTQVKTLLISCSLYSRLFGFDVFWFYPTMFL